MRRLTRALVAIALCAVPAAPAAADPVYAVCLPERVAGCATLDAGIRSCDALPCTEVRPSVCVLVPGAVDVCSRAEPLGGIEAPATGSITIHGTQAATTMALTGVFDPATGQFACTLSAQPGNTVRVRCVPTSATFDWYCAGWVLTATADSWTGQAGGHVSCSDMTGGQELYSGLATWGSPQQATAANLSWFVNGAIVCEAYGYSAGPPPMPDYTVTCNEPGAKTP